MVQIRLIISLILILVSVSFFSVKGESATDNDTVSTDTSQADTTDGNAGLVRKKAVPFIAAGFGPANLENTNSEGLAYNFYGGRYWEVARNAGLKLLGEITTDFDDSFLLGVDIGANLYLLPADISPFIGGEMGFGFTRVSGDNVFGLSFAASAGAQFFRTSDVQLNAEVRAGVLLGRSEGDFPLNYMARLGIFF